MICSLLREACFPCSSGVCIVHLSDTTWELAHHCVQADLILHPGYASRASSLPSLALIQWKLGLSFANTIVTFDTCCERSTTDFASAHAPPDCHARRQPNHSHPPTQTCLLLLIPDDWVPADGRRRLFHHHYYKLPVSPRTGRRRSRYRSTTYRSRTNTNTVNAALPALGALTFALKLTWPT